MGIKSSEAVPTDLGRRLLALRRAAGVGRSELERASGVDAAIVYQIEKGMIRRPAGDVVLKLARVFGTTGEFLVWGDGVAPSDEQVRASVEAARDAADRPAATGTDGEG